METRSPSKAIWAIFVTGTFAVEVMETNGRPRLKKTAPVTGTFAVEVMETNQTGNPAGFRPRYGHLCCRGYGNVSDVSPEVALFVTGTFAVEVMETLPNRRWSFFAVTGTFAVEVMETHDFPFLDTAGRYGHLCCRGYGNLSSPSLAKRKFVTGTFAVEVMETDP